MLDGETNFRKAKCTLETALKGFGKHEMGHGFGLGHRNYGIMKREADVAPSVGDPTLAKFVKFPGIAKKRDCPDADELSSTISEESAEVADQTLNHVGEPPVNERPTGEQMGGASLWQVCILHWVGDPSNVVNRFCWVEWR